MFYTYLDVSFFKETTCYNYRNVTFVTKRVKEISSLVLPPTKIWDYVFSQTHSHPEIESNNNTPFTPFSSLPQNVSNISASVYYFFISSRFYGWFFSYKNKSSKLQVKSGSILQPLQRDEANGSKKPAFLLAIAALDTTCPVDLLAVLYFVLYNNKIRLVLNLRVSHRCERGMDTDYVTSLVTSNKFEIIYIYIYFQTRKFTCRLTLLVWNIFDDLSIPT